MKRFILYTFLLLCALPAAAQTEAEPMQRHLVALQVGSAFAKGDFKASTFEEAYPAFAREGLFVSGSYRYSQGGFWLQEPQWPTDTTATTSMLLLRPTTNW